MGTHSTKGIYMLYVTEKIVSDRNFAYEFILDEVRKQLNFPH